MKTATNAFAAELDDPLGLAPREAELAWATTGPLPRWLDGTDLSESDADKALPRMILESRVETVPELGEKTVPRVDMAATDLESDPAIELAGGSAVVSENRPASINELLDLVNLVSQCSTAIGDSREPAASVPPVDSASQVHVPVPLGSSHVLDSEPKGGGSTSASAAIQPPTELELEPEPEVEPSKQPTSAVTQQLRRVPSLAELAAARDCLIVEAADRCWAVPLHAVVCLKPWPASPADIDVDLAKELGDARLRPRTLKRWMLETTELTFGVDGLRGHGSIEWTGVEADEAPIWVLASADHRGESVGLIDLGRWHRAPVIPDDTGAAAPEPAADPSSAHPPTVDWTPA
jgi:hypothetical protein